MPGAFESAPGLGGVGDSSGVLFRSNPLERMPTGARAVGNPGRAIPMSETELGSYPVDNPYASEGDIEAFRMAARGRELLAERAAREPTYEEFSEIDMAKVRALRVPEQGDGATVLSKPKVQKQSRPAPQPAPDASAAQRPRPRVRLSAVPSSGSGDISEPSAGGSTGGAAAKNGAGAAGDHLVANQPNGEVAYFIDAGYFKTGDYDQVVKVFNRLNDQLMELAKQIEARRLGDQEKRCDFCKKPFGLDNPLYGRQPYEVLPGVWKVIVTCRNTNCEAKFNDAIGTIKQRRGQLG